MGLFEFIFVPLIIFLAFVAPIWIIAHYVTRWRTAKTLSNEDQKLLAELWKSADRMDGRLNNVERILDVEAADWRRGT